MNLSFENNQNVWEYFKNCRKPIILYGMGDGADKVLDAFERFGIEPFGVMATDEFVRGQQFRGFTVKKESDFAAETGDFAVALCFASQLPDVMEHIRQVADRHSLRVPPVPPFGDVVFDRDFLNANREKIGSAYSLLADDQSRRVFVGVLRFCHTGELGCLDEITTDKTEAFEKILKLGKNESYLDLGAYNGDTVDEFLSFTGGSCKSITALEPNAKNFAKLAAHCEGMERVKLLQLGAYSRNDILIFNNKAGRNSAIASKGVETPVAAVDSLLENESVSYVKADVEGADFETLVGMSRTLRDQKPKLNFSAYHRFEDIFRLPLLINSLNPGYRIYLRHHPYIPAWDTNLYCV